jgi:hypothetical protein
MPHPRCNKCGLPITFRSDGCRCKTETKRIEETRKIVRPNFSLEEISFQCDRVKEKIYSRLRQKGPRVFVSSHEILGIVVEEYLELIEAVKSGNKDNIDNELLDLAVACIAGMACEKDWEW